MIREKLDIARRAAEDAWWRVSTVGRVGWKTGLHSAMTMPGAKLLLRELPKGKANPSLAFRLAAVSQPHAIGLTEPRSLRNRQESDRVYSFFEMNDVMDRLGAALSRRGLGKGSAALVMLKNRPEFVLIQAGLNRIGASAVSLSWRSTAPEIEYIAKNSGATALFFDAELASAIEGGLELLGPLIPKESMFSVGGRVGAHVTFDELLASGSAGGAPATKDESEEGAVVMYTSGTTGKPKGAVRRFQKSALAYALGFIGETPMVVGERHLAVCPLYHATAFGFVGLTFVLAGSVVVLPEFKPELVLEAIERYRITTTALVPTMIHRIAELGPDVIRRYDLSSLKCIFSGGAQLPGQLAKEAMDVLGDKIWNFYGATETGIVTVAGPADLRASPGTIGHVVPGNEIRLLDDDGNEVPEGSVGELFVKSPGLVEGYHGDAAATQSSMREGFFSVGDLARKDARGCYFIEGRKRDMIISGGVNVYPAEVEAALEAHPAVAEVAVVGIADKEWGERVRAFVVLRSGQTADAEQLKAFCRDRLATYKIPRDYVLLDALPRNPTGKVLKRELRLREA